jgi:hypothetical protein
MAKTSISLVSVQKPTANTPILQRRNKLTSNIDQQIVKIGFFAKESGSLANSSGSMEVAQFTSSCDTANSRSNWKRVRAR